MDSVWQVLHDSRKRRQRLYSRGAPPQWVALGDYHSPVRTRYRTSAVDIDRGLILFHRLQSLWRQFRGQCPFQGDLQPTRIPLFDLTSSRPTLPFPHPGNYRDPLNILATYFWNADAETGFGRHNRYLDPWGLAPILVTRDPQVIRAVTVETGDGAAAFDRDPLPSTGIARATGRDTLLFSNGATWKRQRKVAAAPFGKTVLFQTERFQEFEETFRATVRRRLQLLRERLAASGQATFTLALEPEIKAVMLEMLVNNFFGAKLSDEEIRQKFIPALERVIDHIVRDTVVNALGIPVWKLPGWTAGVSQLKRDYACFDELTEVVLGCRSRGDGLWGAFRSDAPDEALRSNLKVFLAGALEATTSYASWAISHLSRDIPAQQRVFAEVRERDAFTPLAVEDSTFLGHVMDESLRLTPSLYFLPRRARAAATLELAGGRALSVPQGTHLLLDVWHANRHEDHWGVAVSGFRADEFHPERWQVLRERGTPSKDLLHFGFGHGPRVCPGKHLGQLEALLVVGGFVKLFEFRASEPAYRTRAGVSTKPADGVQVTIKLRSQDGVSN